jgi:hypothetical protein
MKDGAADIYLKRLAEIDRELLVYDRLRAERDKLRELLQIVEGASASAAPTAGRTPITQTLMFYVRAHPGVTGPELANELQDRVITSRPDRRHALIARTHELVKEGRLVRDSEGRISLPDPDSEVQIRKRKR